MNAHEVHLVPTSTQEAGQLLLQAAGAEQQSAYWTAAGLCQASLRGVDSHGIRLLPHYVRGLQGGRLNGTPNFSIQRTSPSTATLDADHALGHAAGMTAMQEAIALASSSGSGFVSVSNSSHCGAMAYFALEAAKQGCIGFACTHATPKVRTHNAMSPFFGTNPMCFAMPMADEEPFCYDAAPTPITFNKVRLLQDCNEPLPPGAAADFKGQETTDPRQATQLLPIGAYKGFGLAMVVDLLCSLLSGMPGGDEVSQMFDGNYTAHRKLGHFFGAIKIDRFATLQSFTTRLSAMAGRIRAMESLDPTTPVMVPGDPEKIRASKRTGSGFPVPDVVFKELQSLSTQFGTPAFEVLQ